MPRCCGRTSRRRRRRKARTLKDPSVDPRTVRLMRWLRKNGLHQGPMALRVQNFPNTGRGLMALKTFKPGEFLISVPENLLITTTTVMESYLGSFIQRFSVNLLSPVETICCFLIVELHKGQLSQWFPYIDVLPTTYSIPAYWTSDERLSLPKSVYQKAEEQLRIMHLSFQKLHDFFRLVESELPSVRGAFTYESFCWAWSSVNTRCVYWEGQNHLELNGEPNHYALVPFLDFFNHSPDAKIEAKFDKRDCLYKIRTLSRISKYSEAFINYGPHDNAKLVVEYGFAVPCNPNDAVRFTIDDLISLCKINQIDSDLDAKKIFLNKFNLSGGMCCSYDGISWNLLAAARILTSSSAEKDDLLKIYLDDETSSVNQNRKNVDLLTNLIGQSLSTIPDVPHVVTEVTYHQKLAYDLCSNYQILLQRCLTALNVRTDDT